MSDEPALSPDDRSRSSVPRHGLRRLLVGILAAESALLVVAFAWQVYELITTQAASLASGIALLVLNLLAAIWVSTITVYASRNRSWVRGAALSWQLVQIAVAVGCFQGVYARVDVGWALLLPAIVAIVLLLVPGVLSSATSRD